MITFLMFIVFLLFLLILFSIRILVLNEVVYKIRKNWTSTPKIDERWYKYHYNEMIYKFAFKFRFPKDEDF